MNKKLRDIIAAQESRYSPRKLELGPVEIRATRNDLLKWLYQVGLIEASEFSAHLADKLFFSDLLRTVAPKAYLGFHPRTEGLQPYLMSADPKTMIDMDFPKGFVVKPVGSMNSDGENILIDEKFFDAYRRQPEAFFLRLDEACELTSLFSSCERYLIQEKIGERLQEYRLHSLEDKVVVAATYTRWNQDWDRTSFLAAEGAFQAFLSALPPFLTQRQAWSVDLMGSPATGFKIVEINTNRGNPGHWSGDLDIPDTLAAYAKHLELHYGARFTGEDGEKLLRGEANQEKYLEKYGPEEVLRHKELRQNFEAKPAY
jgi:hypothetical protein